MVTEKHDAFEREKKPRTARDGGFGLLGRLPSPSRRALESRPWKTDVDFRAQAAEMVLVAFATLTRFACFEA